MVTGFPPQVRRLIRQRADSWCEICGKRRGVQIHHRRPRGMGGTKRPETNTPSGGLLVCVECHQDVEVNRREALSRGWLVPQPTEPLYVPVLYRGQLVFLDDLGNLEAA